MDDVKVIDVAMEGEVAVVSFLVPSISGVSDVDKVAEELRGFIDEKRPGKIIVDFSGVKFFSSQVLGLLVDMWRRSGDYGGKVSISGINPQLGRVFKITNLDSLFKFYPDKQSALDGLS